MAENNSLNIYQNEDEVWNKIAEMQNEVFKTSGRNAQCPQGRNNTANRIGRKNR